MLKLTWSWYGCSKPLKASQLWFWLSQLAHPICLKRGTSFGVRLALFRTGVWTGKRSFHYSNLGWLIEALLLHHIGPILSPLHHHLHAFCRHCIGHYQSIPALLDDLECTAKKVESFYDKEVRNVINLTFSTRFKFLPSMSSSLCSIMIGDSFSTMFAQLLKAADSNTMWLYPWLLTTDRHWCWFPNL